MLARKLRPQKFADLKGQAHVVKALTHALDTDRLHHAYLFTGTRGVGKTTIARILAKSLNCVEGVSAQPCGECHVCMEVKENRFVDLIEVDAASRTGVDDTRDLLDNAQYLPTQGRYKVYLIDEVHMLSTASFNALLKTLEEPPEHVKFLLATTDPKKVPATVLSRCLQFQLKNLSRNEIVDYLKDALGDENIPFDDEALQVIARAAKGSMRDALSLTDQAISYGQGQLNSTDVTQMLGVVGRSHVDAILQGLEQADTQKLLDIAAQLQENNSDFADVLTSLLEAVHELSVAQALKQQVPYQFSAEELQLYYQILLHGQKDLHLAPDERSGFEMTMLRLLSFAPESSSTVPPRGAPDSQEEASLPVQNDAQNLDQNNTQANAELDQSDLQPAPTATHESGLEAAKGKTHQPPATPKPQVSDHQSPTGTDVQKQHAGLRWSEITQELPIGGVTRMIAEHANLQLFDLPQVKLMLDEEHDMLLNDNQTKNLQRALSESLGQPIELTIEVGTLTHESPHQRKQRQIAERQKAAEEQIEKDANVQRLMVEFDAIIEEIRPIS